MLNEYERERIRRAFHLEKKSVYRIAKEEDYSHQTIEKVLSDAPPKSYGSPAGPMMKDVVYWKNQTVSSDTTFS